MNKPLFLVTVDNTTGTSVIKIINLRNLKLIRLFKALTGGKCLNLNALIKKKKKTENE